MMVYPYVTNKTDNDFTELKYVSRSFKDFSQIKKMAGS